MNKPHYQFVLLMLFFCGVFSNAQSQGKWKAIIIASTDEPNISAADQKFIDESQKQVRQMSTYLGLSVDVTVLSGREVNPGRLQELREELTSSSATRYKLLTWMSFSHGFNIADRTSQFPYLVAHPTKTVLSSQEMKYAISLESIYSELISSQNFEHVHIWAELCNQICKGCSAGTSEGLASLSGMGGKKAIEDVLYTQEGSLLVSSAYGQSSCSSITGGIFHRAMREAWAMAERGEWAPSSSISATADFIALVKQLTRESLKQLPRAACEQQTPIGKIGR